MARLRWLLLFVLMATCAQAQLAIDKTVFFDNSSAATGATAPAFSTASANQLLLAFVEFAGGTAPYVKTVAGCGLSWSLVKRTNTQLGDAEIWKAFATSTLSNCTVSETNSVNLRSSIAVATLTGASSTIGATKSATSTTGAPSVSLTTTQNGSWVFGCGNDPSHATARTLGSNQTMVHQYLESNGKTVWVQRQNATTPLSGTAVTLNDTAPTGDSYNMTAVEVLPVAITKTLSSITVSPVTATVAVGAQAQFAATAHYSDSSTAIVTSQAAWTSSNTGIATVGAATGTAIGVAAGSATITATFGGQTDTAALTVTGTHSVDLAWNVGTPNAGSVTYTVQRGNGACPSSMSNLGGLINITQTSVTDSNVSNGATYCYDVTEKDSSTLQSGPSNQATAVIGGATGSPSLVNTASGGAATGTLVTSTSTNAFNAGTGNAVIVFCRTGSNVQTTSVTDTALNTYTAIGSPTQNNTVAWLQAFLATSITGNASNVATCHFANSSYNEVIALQYASAGPFDVTASGTSAGATTVSTSAFTTTAAIEVIVACGTVTGTGHTFTAGPGFTKQVTDAAGDMACEDKLVSTIQSGAVASMTAESSLPWDIVVVTLK